jgi:hypothetical protein
MSHSSATSRAVKRRLERMTERTCATCWSSVDGEGRPERGSSSNEIRPSLNLLYQWYVCVRPMDSLPKACFNIFKVSVKVFPSLTQELTHTLAVHGNLSFSKMEKNQAQNLLGCTAVFLIGCRSTFQRCVLPPSSGRWSVITKGDYRSGTNLTFYVLYTLSTNLWQ